MIVAVLELSKVVWTENFFNAFSNQCENAVFEFLMRIVEGALNHLRY